MRIQIAVWAILIAGVAFGQQAPPQPIERTLQFARTMSTQDFQEVVVLIRTIGDIREVTADPIQRTLVLRASPEQLSIADWIFSKLDGPSTLPAGLHELRIAGSRDDTLRLYHVANTATVKDFQAISTIIRTIADIRYAYTVNGPRVIALRASAGQIAMADWLFQEVDQPPSPTRVEHEFFVPNSSDDVMRVFYLPARMTVQQFQDAAAAIRTATQIRRAYSYDTPRAFIVRGTLEQMAQADRMVQEKGWK